MSNGIEPRMADTKTLETICRRAEEAGFEVGPNEEFWQRIDPRGKHLLRLVSVYVSIEKECVEIVTCHLLAKRRGSNRPMRVLVELLPDDYFGLPGAVEFIYAEFGHAQSRRNSARAKRKAVKA